MASVQQGTHGPLKYPVVLVIILTAYFFVPFSFSETKVEWCKGLIFKTLKTLTSVSTLSTVSASVSLLSGTNWVWWHIPIDASIGRQTQAGLQSKFRIVRAT